MPALGLIGGAALNCALLLLLVPDSIALPSPRSSPKDSLGKGGALPGVSLAGEDDSVEPVAPSRPAAAAPRSNTRNPFALGAPAPAPQPSPIVTAPPPSPPVPAPPPAAPPAAAPPPPPSPPPAPEGTIPGVHIVRRAPVLQPLPPEKPEEPEEPPAAEAPGAEAPPAGSAEPAPSEPAQ